MQNRPRRHVALIAVSAVVITFLAFAPSLQATGDPFINAESIGGVELLPAPGITSDVSTSGWFNINFNQQVLPNQLVEFAIYQLGSDISEAIQPVLSSDGRAFGLLAPHGLKPNTRYEIAVVVEVDGVFYQRIYQVLTGDAPFPAIDYSVPNPAETGVPTNLGGVIMHYNTPMDPAFFSPNNFNIIDLTQGETVISNDQLSPDNRFVGMGTFPWAPNHLFQVNTLAGMRSQAGQVIPGDYSFLFSTDDYSHGLPDDVLGTYPLWGSTVDGKSPVAYQIKPDLTMGPIPMEIWKSLDQAHKVGNYVAEVINPNLVVAVPQTAPGFDHTSANEITLFANLSDELPVVSGPFPGFAWSWTATRPEQFFTDVPVNSQYYSWIKVIQDKQYINGIPNGNGSFRFAGDQNLTRGQGSKIYVNTLHIPVDLNDITTPFSDVSADANGYPAAYINAGVEAGMIQGKTPTRFGPSEPLFYRHVVLMTVRRLEDVLPADHLDPPDDFTIGWGFPEADWAAWNGLLVGIGQKTAEHPLGDPSTIDPFAPIPRNDAAIIAANITIRLGLAGLDGAE